MFSVRLESNPQEPLGVAFSATEMRKVLAARDADRDHFIWLGAHGAQRPLGFRLSAIVSFYDSEEQTELDQHQANIGSIESAARTRGGYEFRLHTPIDELEAKLNRANGASTWKDLFIAVRSESHVGLVEINTLQIERIWQWGLVARV